MDGIVSYYQNDVLRFTAPGAYHGRLRLWLGSAGGDTVVTDVQWELPTTNPASLEGACAAAGGYLSKHSDATCWVSGNPDFNNYVVTPCTGVCASVDMEDSPPANWLAIYHRTSGYYDELSRTFCHSNSGGHGGGDCNSWKGSAPVCLEGNFFESTLAGQVVECAWSVDADPRNSEPSRKGMRLCPCQVAGAHAAAVAATAAACAAKDGVVRADETPTVCWFHSGAAPGGVSCAGVCAAQGMSDAPATLWAAKLATSSSATLSDLRDKWCVSYGTGAAGPGDILEKVFPACLSSDNKAYTMTTHEALLNAFQVDHVYSGESRSIDRFCPCKV